MACGDDDDDGCPSRAERRVLAMTRGARRRRLDDLRGRVEAMSSEIALLEAACDHDWEAAKPSLAGTGLEGSRCRACGKYLPHPTIGAHDDAGYA